MRTIAIVITALAVLFAGAARAEELDFRGARWGMTPDEVRQAEAAPFADMEGLLIYRGTIAGVEADVIYLFQDGRLERGVYSIEPVDSRTVSEDYRKVRSHLLEIHGRPAVEKMNLEEDEADENLDPDDPDDLLVLVLNRTAEPMTYWETETTEIYFRLTETDGRAAIQVDYLSRNR